MKKFTPLFAILYCLLPKSGECQVFAQDFETSTVVADYVSATPTSGQFNAIGTSGAGTVVSIAGASGSQALQFARTANAGSFSRTTDLAMPTCIRYQIDLEVPTSSGASTSVAGFQVGSGYGTANSSESNANTHSRFTINFTANSGEFVIRDVAASVNGPNAYTGPQTIVWFINNSGTDYLYTAPDGSSEFLGNDKWDMWVGNTKEFNERAATTATQTLTDLKFFFSGGTGTININNLVIDAPVILPIQLANFNARAEGASTLLSFSTESEINNDYFTIERSGDGHTFSPIGQVKGAGTTRVPQQYTFTDEHPLAGKNYYRLRQVDFDGKGTYSPVVSVVFGQAGNITLAPSPATDRVLIHLDKPAVEDGTWQVFDMAGRLVQSGVWASESDETSINVGALTEGMYTFRLAIGQTSKVKQFRKQ